MRQRLQYILLFVLALGFSLPIMAQSVTEQAAREELARRGLADQEDRIKEELLAKGIDINNVNINNPAEVARVQKELDAIIKKIEAEKNAAITSKRSASNSSISSESPSDQIKDPQNQIQGINDQEILEAVKDGATVEEAINEEIQEAQEDKLPKTGTYGQHIFRSQSVQFYRKSGDAKAPSSYVLGPGDKIAISIWGLSVYNESFTISDDGYISPFPDLRVYLSGIKLGDAKTLIKSKIGKYVRFRSDDFDVSVLASRTININISGEVFNYGNFNVSALNNAFNALVASGGPTDLGSVRKVQLKRAGEQVRTLDIYKYIQDPIVGDDYYLKENDYLYIPVAEKVVTIGGAVKRGFKYELLPNETLEDLVKYAGGLDNKALTRNIQIERRKGESLEIIDVNYDQSSGKRFRLQNGDIVRVPFYEAVLENVVSIQGAVKVGGRYALTEGMRISDLIEKGILEENAITDVAYLKRKNEDQITTQWIKVNITEILANEGQEVDLELKKGDALSIKALSNFKDSSMFSISGAVRQEGDYPITLDSGIRISDAIFLSGGLTREALDQYAYLYRKTSPRSVDVEYVAINLKNALLNPGSTDNVELRPNDRLVIFNKNAFAEEFFIEVSGEVADAKSIKYNTTLKLQDALRLAGGLRLESNPDRINIYRIDFSNAEETKVLAANLKINDDLSIEGGGDFQLRPFDQIIVRRAPDFENLRNVSIKGEVKYPGKYVLTKDNTKITELIKDAGGLTDEAFIKGVQLFRNMDNVGYVIFDLDEAIKNPKSFNNIILQEGDEIILPKLNNLITIEGATKANEIYASNISSTGRQTFPYEAGKNAKYYIDKYAGGVNDNGDKSEITVEYPNGEIKRVKRVLFFRDYPDVKPGSKIKVGYKETKKDNENGGEEKEPIDWGRVLSDSVAQATTILSLILLIQNID